MSEPKKNIHTEEIIFFVDLISNYFKQKIIVNGIEDFISQKSKISDSHYGIVIFQKEDNPVHIYHKENAEVIIEAINDTWEERETKQSHLENGLFEILSYIFRKSRKDKNNYRIIIFSDTPSFRSEEYHNAVYDLIVKSKRFSTIVDIIRIGDKEYYEDDVKLKVITSETQGGIFYCYDKKQFSDILNSLVQSKHEFNIVKGAEDGFQVLEEDKTFYERLAADLISLSSDEEEKCSICQEELCPICEAYSDEIRKCFNCGAKFHGCCASNYSIKHNIGFNHIFRCPQCETLLKVDEELVIMILEEDYGGGYIENAVESESDLSNSSGKSINTEEEKQKILPPKGLIDILEAEEKMVEDEVSNDEPSIGLIDVLEANITIEESDEEESKDVLPSSPVPPPPPPSKAKDIIPSPPPFNPPASMPTKKVKVGGFFGHEIEVKDNNHIAQSSEIAKPPSESSKASIESDISITKLRPPKRKSSIKFCKICGASVRHSIKCPTCGAKMD